MDRNTSFSAPLICAIGDIGVDLVMGMLDQWPQLGTELVLPRSELRAGGSAGNAVLALRHLGAPARLVSAVGDDDFGRWLSAQFEGVDARLAVCEVASTVSVGLMHRCSERNFFTTEGHLAAVTLEQVLERVPPAVPGSIALLTGVFLLPRLRPQYPQLLAKLRARGYQLALDTGWPSEGWTEALRAEVLAWLPACDHLLLNELEVRQLAGTEDVDQAMRIVLAHLPLGGTLVVKAGARGALAARGSQRLRQSAEAAEVFDTIGAGDSFNAGYLAACLRGAPLQQALACACQLASAVLARFPRRGIQPGEFRELLLAQPA